ncbi:uncharacterized protein LOC135810300 [Sycon ciliatum]|uniref:uncharacterized protein LOC135810300 n=1 Tax=Sycon ciliatum TaxID=27933 RepID=UPI0031F68E0A
MMAACLRRCNRPMLMMQRFAKPSAVPALNRGDGIRSYAAAAAQLKPSPVYTEAPPRPQLPRSLPLSAAQVEHYFKEGYLICPSFVDVAELDDCLKAVEGLVDYVANRLYDTGRIKDKCESAPVSTRLWLLEKQFKGASVLIHKAGVLPKEFQRVWSGQKLLDAVTQFIGGDIAGHPVWNLRSKTPHTEQATVPWHQDNAYLDPECENTLQVTAWIPLVDANQTNGCIQVLRGGHRSGVTAKHTCCAGDTWYVQCDMNDMEHTLGVNESDVVTCEMPRGGVLFMNNAIPHRSTENLSEAIRWSLDLRWQDPAKPHGFHNLKDPVTMRLANQPGYQMDWTTFAGIDRTKLQLEQASEEAQDYFETTIAGPWMERWEITHPNRHTNALNAGGLTGWHSKA